ncbi:PREDICTED: ceramide-1-phosphate transfer protein isoform X2 [Atta colombica]|uniref:ceramide-1-phosphate transfer protein isoform X2 n=1 Tax=Atta colombica TaxID=520822 RepID=UPI00084C76B4|nr:PREDICTED: ceramide-1-phosphate transfer protein isoform X2 [Atta colombica]
MAEGPELSFFDLRTVHDHFDQALVENDDIDLKAYLEAYNELYKFFQLMGSVFSFVSSDLKQKIDVLTELKKKADFINGARTLLRLHRGLDFIREFLQQLGDLTDVEKTTSCCQDAYNKTLAKHHPWMIRKAAIVAMYTMPSREILFKKVCGENVQRNIDVLPKMLEVTADVFNRTDSIYEIYQLHALP